MSQKLICVQRDTLGLLYVGEIYTFALTHECLRCGKKHTMVEEFPYVSQGFGITLCPRCGLPHPTPAFYGFEPRRFALWNPDSLGITEKEVLELYTSKEIERAKG